MKSTFLLLALIFSALQMQAQRQFWIVGGDNAQEGQFPWIGDMRLFDSHRCGSSLIAPDWVLTAAHCVQGASAQMVTQMVFRFNTVRSYGGINPNGGVQRNVKKIFAHPAFDFNRPWNGYDIALCKLSEPVTTIDPISLPSVSDTAALYAVGRFVDIAGWGIADTASIVMQPDTMKYGTSRIQNCTAGILSPGFFCIGYNNGDSSQYQVGSAAGDSGGPAWVEDNGIKRIIGIVSGGNGQTTTAGNPGIFTKVTEYREWIDSVMTYSNDPTSIPTFEWNDNNVRMGFNDHSLALYFGSLNAKLAICDIYNVDGKKVFHQEIASPSFTTQLIPFNMMSNGMYIVRIYDPKSQKGFSKKVMKAY